MISEEEEEEMMEPVCFQSVVDSEEVDEITLQEIKCNIQKEK